MVKHLDHLNMTVTNVEETTVWYKNVFGFEKMEQGLYRGRPWAILRSGEAMLCIYEHADFQPAGSPTKKHGLNHFAFRITDREAWEKAVKRHGIKVAYGGAVDWPHSTAWYVEDPNGYEIEVALWDNDKVTFDRAA